MAIPKFYEIMLPFLELISDRKEHKIQELFEKIADYFKLSDEERTKMLDSGNDIILNNRVRFARLYLKQAGLIEYVSRGTFKITQRGLDVLKSKPKIIDVKFLEQYPEFIEFRYKRKKETKNTIEEKQETLEDQTPEEILDSAYSEIRQTLTKELIGSVKDCSPQFFEKLVVELLLKMGYGGSRKDAGAAIGKSGDGGIDGIIKEDKLGLDVIYIQAKRWRDGTVGRSDIQKFVGALVGKQAHKGIFITTSTFTNGAIEYANNVDVKVILIDGAELAKLMIDYNVGVSVTAIYELKKIDSDYFVEE